MSVAFFDLDKTLLAVNSATLWVRRELALGHITRVQALRASLWIARYHLGFVSMEDVLLRGHLPAGGHRPQAHPRAHRHLLHGAGAPAVPAGALRALEEHRARGTGWCCSPPPRATSPSSSPGRLRLDGILCNRFEVDERGLHTGRPLGDVCFGPGKRTHAEAYARGGGRAAVRVLLLHGLLLGHAVLEVVGRPVAVHPDYRLRREALRRGWPVVDWGVPVAGVPAAGSSAAP